MNKNQEAIILAEQATDDGSLRAVLSEWGYRESEIQRFLSDPKVDQKRDQRRETSDQSSRNQQSVF